MVNPAPVRVARKSTMNSPLVKAANKIVTSPTFAKARSIDFDKKNEYDKFIKFIESSNKELLRIKLPRKEDVVKEGPGSGDGDGKDNSGRNNFLKGLIAERLLRRFKPFRKLRRFLIPRRFRARLRKLRMDLLRPFRNFKKTLLELPGKIRTKLGTIITDTRKFFNRKTSEVVEGIKNLKNAKWIKKLTSKVDDVAKTGKEIVTNSKVLKTSKEITEQVAKKAGPKISSLAIGELTIIGGIAYDLGSAVYRAEQGDNTGALLSTFSAVPILGIPFSVVDVARDMGAFEEGGMLDKIDFLNLFRLNKDNPNYVDKRTTEEKEIDENLDEYLRETYEKNLREELESIKGMKGKNYTRRRMSITNQLRDLPDLTSDQLRSKVNKGIGDVEIGDIKFFGKNKSSYDEIQTFLENIENKESISTESLFSENVTTLIDNSQIFLLPDSDTSKSMFAGETSAPPINVNTSIIEFDYSKVSDAVSDELLFLKLDK
jgi:hypothetical protein